MVRESVKLTLLVCAERPKFSIITFYSKVDYNFPAFSIIIFIIIIRYLASCLTTEKVSSSLNNFFFNLLKQLL